MKKFYEIPTVEITVFDVEDVITASVTSTATLSGKDLETFIAGVEAKYSGENYAVSHGEYSAYNW